MKNSWKKTAAFVLAFTLVAAPLTQAGKGGLFGGSAILAKAAPGGDEMGVKSGSVEIGNTTLSSGQLYVNGVDVATGTLPDGCSFDAETNTLTLNGATITQCAEGSGIYYGGNSQFNIVLVGDNTIDISSTDNAAGIVANSLINISGTGKLTVKCKDQGIIGLNGVNFNSGTVDVEAKYVAVNGGYGNIIIGNATVTATATDTCALFGYDTNSISGIYVINSIAGKGWADAAGTEGETAIEVSETGQYLSAFYKKVQFTAAAPKTIVITSENFSDYFETNGYLKDSVAAGSTLDFKGTFYGPNYTVHINKQVNITSSDNSAVFDSRPSETGTVDTDNLLNFQFETGADNSTVSNLKFRNCWLHIKGSEHLTFDNIDVFVNERVGTGKGFISIYGGANNATIKNSNIECTGNGGSACIAVRAGAKDVTFENNIIKTSGNVGNVFYVSPYNTDGYSGSQDHITFKNNTIINGSDSISYAIVLFAGKDHVVEGNNIYCTSIAITDSTLGSTVTNTTIKNNTITGGGSITIGKNGNAEGNVTNGSVTVGENATFKNNTMYGVNKTLTISGASAEVSGNTVKGNVSISGQGAVFTDNNVTGTVTVGRSSKGNTITGNTIVSSGEYAVVLSSTASDSNTTVTGNTLIAAEKGGDDAVKPGTGGGNTIENNKDYLTVTEDKPLVVKEGSKFTVNKTVTISGSGSNAQVTAGVVFEVSKTQEGNWLVKSENSEAYNKPVSAEIPTGTLLVSISGGTLTFTENQVYTNKTINASDIKQGDVLAVATKVTADSENMCYQKANGDYQEYTSSSVEIGLTGLMNSSTLEVPFANADKNAFIYTEKKDGKCYFDQTYAYFHGNITAENGITVTKGEDTLEDGARNNVEGEVVFTSDNFFVVKSGTAQIPATLDTSATPQKYTVTHTMAGDANAVIEAVEVKTGSTYTYFKTLEEAIESANAESGSSTITLKDNVETTSSNITIPSGKSLTLDLQGKACTGNAVLINNGSLTIRDGSTGGTGTFSLSINNNKSLGLYNATFTKGIVTLGDDNPQTVVSSGHIHSVSIDKECNGTLYISGGKIDSVNIDEDGSGTLTLRGGVFKEKPDGNLSTYYKLLKLADNSDGYSYGVIYLSSSGFDIANVSPKDYDGVSGVELSVTPPTSTSQLQIAGYNIEYTYQWAKKDGENFTDIPGATNASYTTGANVADSGTYQCTVMSGDTVVKTLTKDVTINKANITPSVSIEGWTYGATASAPSVSGNTGNGGVTYLYKAKDADDSTYSETVPTAVGQYTVKASIAETADYKAGEDTADFTIAKATPTPEAPTNLTAAYGKKLSDITLPDGWTWDAPDTSVGDVGNNTFAATFTPTDIANYNNYSANLTVAVTAISATPTAVGALNATYGDTLADVELPTVEDGSGSWAWKDAATTPVGNAGEQAFKAVFTPSSPNYTAVEQDVTINVAKADPTPDAVTGLTVAYGKKLSDVTLPTGWTWDAPETSVGDVGNNTFAATFTPTDTDNYNTLNQNLTVNVVAVDKTSLNEAVTAANTYLATIQKTVYADPALALISAITDAKAVAENDNVTEAQVAQAITDVNNAVTTAKAAVKDIDDTKAAQAVTDKINALPAAEAIKSTDKEAVEAARAAYANLTEAQSAKVTKAATDKLTAAEKAVADRIAADAVIAKINAISEVVLTNESKALIDAARTAYEALATDAQKALVSNYTTLTADEQKYSDLQVGDVKAKIDAIGDIELSDESKAAIDTARAAFKALNADQQALVANAKVLDYAEKLYDALEDKKTAETDKATAQKAAQDAAAAQAAAETALANAEKDAADKVAAAQAAQKTAETAQATAEKAAADAKTAQTKAEEEAAAAKTAQANAEKAKEAAETALANAEKDAAAKVAAAQAAQKTAETAKATAEKAAADAKTVQTKAEEDAAAAKAAQATAEKAAADAKTAQTKAEEEAAAAKTAQATAENAQATAEKAAADAKTAQTKAEEEAAAAKAAQATAEKAAADAKAAQAKAEEDAATAKTAQATAEKAAADAKTAQTKAEEDAAAAKAAQATAEKAAADAKTAQTKAEEDAAAAKTAQATAEKNAEAAKAAQTKAEEEAAAAKAAQATAEKNAETAKAAQAKAEEDAATAKTAQATAEKNAEAANSKVSDLTEQLAAAVKQIEELESSGNVDEALKKQVAELKEQLDAAKTAQNEANEALAKAQDVAAAKIAAAEAAQEKAEEEATAAEKAQATAEQTAKEATEKAAAAEKAQATAEQTAKEATEKAAAAEKAQATAEQTAKEATEKAAAAEKAQATAEQTAKEATEKAAAAEKAQATAEQTAKEATEKAAAAEKAQATAEQTAKEATEKAAAAEKAQATAEQTAKEATEKAAAAEEAQKVAEAAQAEAEKKAAEDKAAADKAAADKVIKLIDAIGNVEKTNTSENKIVAARAAYDALTDEQKALVTNYTVLTKAESAYKTLPQTGMSGFHKVFAGLAALMGITGMGLIKKSRKEDEEE